MNRIKGFVINEINLWFNAPISSISTFTVYMTICGMIVGGATATHHGGVIVFGMGVGAFYGLVWPITVVMYPVCKIFDVYLRHQ
jgi:hypothetical protein